MFYHITAHVAASWLLVTTWRIAESATSASVVADCPAATLLQRSVHDSTQYSSVFESELAKADCPDSCNATKAKEVPWAVRAECDSTACQACSFCQTCSGSACASSICNPLYDFFDLKPYVACNLDVIKTTPRGGVAFLGDSNIDYWRGQPDGISSGHAVPNSSNVGAAGATCAGLAKWTQDVLDQLNPETVVLHCGENDILYDDLLPGSSSFLKDPDIVKTTYAHLEKVWTTLHAHLSVKRVIYLGTLAEPATGKYHQKHREYDEIVKQGLALQEGFIFVDSYQAFEDRGNTVNLYADDKIHLSVRGYTIWNDVLIAALNANSTR